MNASIAVGTAVPPMSATLTHERVLLYAEASNDWNPLHVDEEFARGTRFGRTIVHGQLVLALISECIDRWVGPSYAVGSVLEVTFIRPVATGAHVTVGGAVTERDSGAAPEVLVCEVWAEVDGERVVAGTARIPIGAA